MYEDCLLSWWIEARFWRKFMQNASSKLKTLVKGNTTKLASQSMLNRFPFSETVYECLLRLPNELPLKISSCSICQTLNLRYLSEDHNKSLCDGAKTRSRTFSAPDEHTHILGRVGRWDEDWYLEIFPFASTTELKTKQKGKSCENPFNSGWLKEEKWKIISFRPPPNQFNWFIPITFARRWSNGFLLTKRFSERN